MKYGIQHKAELSCAYYMHHFPTEGTSPQRTLRSIPFTLSSEWVMISGMGVRRHPDERSSVTISKGKSPFSTLLVSPFLCDTVFLLSRLYSSFDCLTVLLLSIVISPQNIFPDQSAESPLPWQQCHIIMFLLGWEEMCSFVVAVRLNCRARKYGLNQKIWATFISVKSLLNGSHLEACWEW